jgi:hypothetical protein
MPVAFYMDEQVSRKITKGLRTLEVDVLTVQEDGFDSMPDVDILDRASYLNRVIVTYDHHFVIEANRRLDNGIYFYGVVYITDDKTLVGKLIEDLELIANVADHSYFNGKGIEYLPY